MNLTKSIRALIVDRFIVGATISECALWYGQKPEKVEAVLREELKILVEQMAEERRLKGDADGTSEKA